MKVIGLCGGSGSGKGLVCSIFSELSVPSIDTDALYREMTEKDSPCLRALRAEFGDEIISKDGSLNRSALRNIVFLSEKSELKRKKLNLISHKFILNEVRFIIEKNRKQGVSAVLVDAPLLYESGFDRECDLTVCVIADEEIRLKRIMERDGISKSDALARIRGQISNEMLINISDHVIENNGDIEKLRRLVTDFYENNIKNEV